MKESWCNMREIKFRGKTAICQLATSEDCWVYGGVHSIYENDDTCYIAMNDYFKPRKAENLLVKKETVGQYTGLKDNNGVEIYEGDIVKAKFFNEEIIGYIGFAIGCFMIAGSGVSDNQMFVFNDIEVIGNIYDNPELLVEKAGE